MNRLLEKIPPMLIGAELEKQLTCLPDYDPAICKADAGTRLMQLNPVVTNIYSIPNEPRNL